MEDFFKREHIIIGDAVAEGFEEGGHFGLPAGVDGVGLHGGAALREVVGFKIADEEAVGAEEDGVVLPAGFLQGGEHLGPDARVAFLVLRDFLFTDL